MSTGLMTMLGLDGTQSAWLVAGVGIAVVAAGVAMWRRRPRTCGRCRTRSEQGDGDWGLGWWFLGGGSDRSPGENGPDAETTPVESNSGWGGNDGGGGDSGGGGDGGGGGGD